MRSLLCRIFRLRKVEEYSWEGLLDAKDTKIVWPRIVNSRTWKDELEPLYRQMLLRAAFAMAQEQDQSKLMRHQERVRLLNEFLETPRLATDRENAYLENMRMTGTDGELRSSMERMGRVGTGTG